jgi:hypothetical protein
MVLDMVKVNYTLLMVVTIKVNGLMISFTVKAPINGLMGKSTQVEL